MLRGLRRQVPAAATLACGLKPSHVYELGNQPCPAVQPETRRNTTCCDTNILLYVPAQQPQPPLPLPKRWPGLLPLWSHQLYTSSRQLYTTFIMIRSPGVHSDTADRCPTCNLPVVSAATRAGVAALGSMAERSLGDTAQAGPQTTNMPAEQVFQTIGLK